MMLSDTINPDGQIIFLFWLSEVRLCFFFSDDALDVIEDMERSK